MLLSSQFDIIVQQVRLLSKWLVKVEGAVCSMHVVNPKKYLAIQLCWSADRRTNFFCVCVFRH